MVSGEEGSQQCKNVGACTKDNINRNITFEKFKGGHYRGRTHSVVGKVSRG